MRSSSSQTRADPSGSDPRAGSEPGAYPEGFPQVFGKYVLVRPMARGGMGELFLAAAGETGGFEKLCVVKKVLHSLEDAAVHRRFLDEAKVVVRLNHANLVQVFDAGKVDNEYYLAMELVEGKDLRAVWNRCAQLHRRIPVDVAIFVIREVLRGLDYVHDAMGLDLVHRDISPPNLLVGYRGDVKLTDFGLAKSAIKREMTSPGVVFGRYSYLSPEQARGLPADRRTDIYACGIVLWELLTGRQLFPSSNRSHQEALDAVRNPKVRAPSALVPGIPEGLDSVVLEALARERERRYDTAGAFRSALSDLLARNFPTCDADRVSEFMREIFARESRTEARDYTRFTQHDFSALRASADDSDLVSIGDVLDPESRSSTIHLAESDIVELDRGAGERHGAPSVKSLRDSAQEWVGRVVGQRYRIDSLLGIGGMGAVFRATHLALGKPFALKVLHNVYTRDSDIITRFMREARAATQTGHPNIIDVLDIGTTEDGDVYFVMELLGGANLGTVIHKEGPMAVRRAVHIARQICRALAAAHEVGIIHRDLKSENVILTSRGKDPDFVKVLDFGICKHMNADSSTTSPGLVMGSPDYMAPEQGAGLEAAVSSDVYAVGCILFEMLTGRLPFQGRNAVDVLMQKGAREAPRVSEFRAEIPRSLADVVARCLRRQPGDRPPSMRALEYELTRAMDGRANAVAAVLGLDGAGDGDHTPPRGHEEPAPDASASMHRAAIASMNGAYSVTRQERTQIAPPPTAAAPTGSVSIAVERKAATPLVAGVKALFFVALGGVLAAAAVLAVSPETVGRLSHMLGLSSGAATPDSAGEPVAVATAEPSSDSQSSAPAGNAGAAGPDEAKEAPAEESAPAAEATSDAEPAAPDQAPGPEVVDDAPPDAEKQRSPDAWVAMAERALAANEWTEPPERSMATALHRLEIADPGNEAIGRLRRAAAEQLMPLGLKAMDHKEYDAAAEAFRNLRGVWPDHPEAKQELIEALWEISRRQRKAREFEAALVTADELLNLEPDEFRVLSLKADLLWYLERWDECKTAYWAARRVKPRNDYVNKRFWKCKAKAKSG